MMLVPGAAHRAPSASTSGPCGSSPTRRSPRRSPPPAGSPCPPSCAGCCAQQGRDLHGEFLRLLPYRLPPIRIQRWSLAAGRADHRHPVRRRARGRASILDQPARAAAVRRRPGRGPAGRSWPRWLLAGCASDTTATTRAARLCATGDDTAPTTAWSSWPSRCRRRPGCPASDGAAAGLELPPPRRPQRRRPLLAGLRPRRPAGGRGPARASPATRRAATEIAERPRGHAPAGAGRPDDARAYAGERYYVFAGGCITVVFRLDGDSARGEALALRHPGGRRGEPRPTCRRRCTTRATAGSPSTRPRGKAGEP